jgi:hypothetical protein
VGEKDLRDLRELLGAASKKNVPFLCVGAPPADLSVEERRRWLTHLVTDGAEGVTGPIDLSRGLLVASGLINIGLDLPFRRVFFPKDRPDPRMFDAIVYVGLDRYPAVYAQVPIRYAKDHARLIFSGAETDRPARVFRPKNREALLASGFTERDINDYEGRGGDRPVPVSVNGDQILIRRNEWVKIPYRFYLAMMNAVQTTYEPITNDVGKMVDQKAIDQLAFPFNSRNGPSQAELDQWAKAKQAESARVAKEKQEERRMAARLRKAAEEMEAA